MRQIRQVMAQSGGAQARLDQFVSIIARNFVAEVCSIYLKRAGGSLELCATEGLDPDAVHRTRLNAGEGLVGYIAANAEPLRLTDARAHPAFVYLPETGEDRVASFLGVPILRGGRPIGVLTVQNSAPRQYDEEEVETLQTAAMILAEVVTDPTLATGLEGIELRPSRPERHVGRRINAGVAIGVAVKREPHVAPTQLIAENPEYEAERLERAIAALRKGVDSLFEGRTSELVGAPREVLEVYRMFANDRGWLERLIEAVRSGLTAEAAVERVRNEHRAKLMSARDSYLRERLHDLEDLANRMLRHLAEDEGRRLGEPSAGIEDGVIFARTLGPAELLEFDPAKLRGVVVEEGSAFSHAAIVARALGVPMIGRAEGILDRVENGDAVIVDGERAEVHLRPTNDVVDAYKERMALSAAEEERIALLKDEPSVTRDGRAVSLLLNVGLNVDLAQIERVGADGIGLFRTEFQFMLAERLPRQDEQTALYRAALDAADEKPVVFRTLDLGGDKLLPYAEIEREENPAMGWRAVRLGLERSGLMRRQLRALVAAAAGRELSVMFPLVATVTEFRDARGLLEKELERAARRGDGVPTSFRVGAMLEAPALAFQLDELMRHADFLSIGANDLLQFFFAADRGHAKLAERYDPLNPAALRFLKQIRDACAAQDKPVTVCGEIAGRPLEAMTLIALGFDRLSMAASSMGRIKRLVLSLDAERAAGRVGALIASSSDTIRPELVALASELGATL